MPRSAGAGLLDKFWRRFLFGMFVLPFIMVWDTWQNDNWANVALWEWAFVGLFWVAVIALMRRKRVWPFGPW
ncbi:MAG TPA: hypothetical protein VGW38_06825 [Chloroflexota bacterium]|nr:hypothetical protein [Chloroflexota bacterium]